MVNIFTQHILRTIKSILFKAVFLCGFAVVCSFNVPGAASTSSTIFQVKLVKCYPNPATSFVNFEVGDGFSAKGYALEVYSFAGKKMFETPVSSGKINLTLDQNYYRGIYVYQLKDKTAKIVETGKFQVVR